MKKVRFKVIIIIGIVLILIAVYFNWNNPVLPQFEYTSDGYTYGGEININGVKYIGISEDLFEKIYDSIRKQGIVPFNPTAIGRINYINADEVWEYNIYGNETAENRILLKGEEDIAFNDVCFPVIYCCRQDILESYKDTETE